MSKEEEERERQKKLNESLEDSYRDKASEKNGTLENLEPSGSGPGGYSSENLRKKRFKWSEYKLFF